MYPHNYDYIRRWNTKDIIYCALQRDSGALYCAVCTRATYYANVPKSTITILTIIIECKNKIS